MKKNKRSSRLILLLCIVEIGIGAAIAHEFLVEAISRKRILHPIEYSVSINNETTEETSEAVLTESKNSEETSETVLRKSEDSYIAFLMQGKWDHGNVHISISDESTIRIEIKDYRHHQSAALSNAPWTILLKFGTEIMQEYNLGEIGADYPFSIKLDSMEKSQMELEEKWDDSDDKRKNLHIWKNEGVLVEDSFVTYSNYNTNPNIYSSLNATATYVKDLEIEKYKYTYTAFITLPDWFDRSVLSDLEKVKIVMYKENSSSAIEEEHIFAKKENDDLNFSLSSYYYS